MDAVDLRRGSSVISASSARAWKPLASSLSLVSSLTRPQLNVLFAPCSEPWRIYSCSLRFNPGPPSQPKSPAPPHPTFRSTSKLIFRPVAASFCSLVRLQHGGAVACHSSFAVLRLKWRTDPACPRAVEISVSSTNLGLATSWVTARSKRSPSGRTHGLWFAPWFRVLRFLLLASID